MPEFAPLVVSRSVVKASAPPAGFPAEIRASNLDLIINSFHLYILFIYPPAAVDFSAAVAAAAASLPAFLNHFFPFAGRLKVTSPGEISVLNNNAGAEFVVAEAAVALADVDFTDARKSFGCIPIPFGAELALSLQLVRFACGGLSVAFGSDHVLVDGHGFHVMSSAWSELLRTGGISRRPHHGRSMFAPRSPPQFDPSLDEEFVPYDPDSLVNSLLAGALVRRMYFVEASDVERIHQAASSGRKVSRFAAFSAYVWKLLAAAADGLDERCRMAWAVDGRRRLGDRLGASLVDAYVGNIITYASKEAEVRELKRLPLAGVASAVQEAIRAVATEKRFQESVDWMEVKRKEGKKWTEKVGVGLGSPAVVMSAVLPEPYEGDFGFGKPTVTMPWLRPGRLGSASIILVPVPANDGSWVLSTRLWPGLAAAMDSDEVFKPLTAARLGLGTPRASRM